MSTFKAFERSKVARFINVYGNIFTFRRRSLNDYGEPKNECECIAKIRGVYHNPDGPYRKQSIEDSSEHVSKPQPMILCLQDENSSLVKPDDIVQIGKSWFTVVRLVAVGEFDYAWEIVLELIEDGTNI